MEEPPEVGAVRHVSRLLVRELGFLHGRFAGATAAQVHLLIELERLGQATATELARLLRLDKSGVSRALAELRRHRWVNTQKDPADARRQLLVLTEAGRRQLARVHTSSNEQVGGALALLSQEDRARVVDGMRLYARALARSREQSAYLIRPIQPKDDAQVANLIRTVMPEFGASGAGFAILDPEVDAMCRAYSGRNAAYFVLEREGRVVGGGGVAPLAGGAAGTCELRKMYFLPETRGLGLGARLLKLSLHAARERGFGRCYLETLEKMTAARRLYESFGFTRLSRAEGATGHYGCDAWYALDLTTNDEAAE